MTNEFQPATPRVAAGVLFVDDSGRVLLVKPTYKTGWDLPGGYVEPGESPKDAARREVSEELGADRAVGRLLVVDWAPHPEEGDKLLFVFDGGDLDLNGITRDRDELADTAYVPVDELETHLSTRLLERVRAALTPSSDPYLEHGQAPI